MTHRQAPLRSPAAALRVAQAVAADRRGVHRRRLERLEQQLALEGGDNRLRIDIFEAALAAGEWARAQRQVDAALAVPDAGALAWKLRAGELLLARRADFEAAEHFAALAATHAAPGALHDALLPHLAEIDLRQDRPADAVERLASTLEGVGAGLVQGPEAEAVPATWPALCRLWLRALQCDGQTTRALAWARRAHAAARLDADAAGVAALAAIDEGDPAQARQWAARSVDADAALDASPPPEAAVALASLALLAQDAAGAVALADIALHTDVEHGRAWSVRGQAHLMAGELEAAAETFSRALALLPAHVGSWLGLGWTRLRQGELAAARIGVETALALDDQRAESHGQFAVVLAMQGDHAGAERHSERALRLDEGNAAARIAQALLRGEVADVGALSGGLPVPAMRAAGFSPRGRLATAAKPRPEAASVPAPS